MSVYIVWNAHNTVFGSKCSAIYTEGFLKFFYGVYRPGQWLWIDSDGKNGNQKYRRG